MTRMRLKSAAASLMLAVMLAACQTPGSDAPENGEATSPAEEAALFDDDQPQAATGQGEEGSPETETREVPAEQPSFEPKALEVIAALNDWRVEQDLWPFQPNETLTELALQQAEYLMTLTVIPSGAEIHLDGQAGGPKDRALAADWPHYGREDQLAITEIAAVNADADAAVTWWKGSQIHREAVVDPTYREIGAAALEHPAGILYVVVLGARPGVLTAQFDPLSGWLYLSSERYQWAATGDWIQDVTETQVIEAGGAIDESAWGAWKLTLDAPETEQPYAVAFSDGNHEVTVEVRPGLDIAWLPGNLSLNRPTAELQQAAAVEAAAQEAVAEPAFEGPDATLVYNDTYLMVLNSSPDALDLSRLELHGEAVTVPLTLWDPISADAPVSDFPAGDCLLLYDWNTPDPGVPAGCRFRRGVVYLSPQEVFWTQGDFEVRSSGRLLATCEAGQELCEVDLP